MVLKYYTSQLRYNQITAQNAVKSGIKALLAKPKRPIYPRPVGITSPFDPGGWSVAVSAWFSTCWRHRLDPVKLFAKSATSMTQGIRRLMPCVNRRKTPWFTEVLIGRAHVGSSDLVLQCGIGLTGQTSQLD